MVLLTGSLWQIIRETSGFGLFVLLVLVFMSLASWAIIFHKWRQYRRVDDDSDKFIHQFRRSRKLSDVAGQAAQRPNAPVACIYQAGYNELVELKGLRNEGGGLQEKTRSLGHDDFELVEMTMERALTDQRGELENRIVFLATTGSSAPFLGLLGTVVGIMDSFWSIGEVGSASLAVVAPGIAEALLATIVGLGTAIPAVIAYNWANNKTRSILNQTDGFIIEFMTRAKKEEL